MGETRTYPSLRRSVKGRRAAVERLLDALHWAWDGGVSLLLDQAVLDEEAG